MNRKQKLSLLKQLMPFNCRVHNLKSGEQEKSSVMWFDNACFVPSKLGEFERNINVSGFFISVDQAFHVVKEQECIVYVEQ